MRSHVRTVVIVAITLGLLAFFFRDADFAGVWAETRRADPWLLLAAVIVTGITYAFRAWRWQSLLAPIGETHFSTAFRTTIIGFSASFFLPARAGEVIRPYLLARREGLPPTAAFATIILERLLDLVVVLLLFGLFILTVSPGVLTSSPTEFAHVKFWGSVAAGGAVATLAVLFALAGHPERLGRAAGRIERVLPERIARIVAQFVENFAQGLAVMRRPAQLGIALLQSLPVWLSIAAGIWLTSQAFSITFPYTGSFLVMTLLVVGVAVPTPGQIGGFHAAYQIAVQTFFGVPDDRAVGAAIVLHAVSFVPVTLLGLVFMAREGMTFQNAQELASSQSS
jgi:glycosyltransferase 2 family protein